jgi:hypothetical protein
VGKVKKRNPEPFIPLGFVAGQSMQGGFWRGHGKDRR